MFEWDQKSFLLALHHAMASTILIVLNIDGLWGRWLLAMVAVVLVVLACRACRVCGCVVMVVLRGSLPLVGDLVARLVWHGENWRHHGPNCGRTHPKDVCSLQAPVPGK